jgi:saccharopine dehydrogenase (NAD+, L-lysine-forming)
MRVLVVGAGGVGSAIAVAAQRREFFDHFVIADVDPGHAAAAVERLPGDRRFAPAAVDASDREAIVALARETGATAIVNACDPRFNPPIFDAAFESGCTYLDMAMHLSAPHPERPHELTGVKLGDEQFAVAPQWDERGLLALVGIGTEPGFSDVAARYAADHLFSHIAEIGVRDGANLVIEGFDFAPTFSIWTTIEECLNPPVIWEAGRGWYTTAPFSEPETFDFPAGIGPIECVNVEHEEVLLVPRWIDCGRVTFKVRARRRVHRGAPGTAQDRARFDGANLGSGHCGRAARRRRRGAPPILRPSARACAASRARERGSAAPAPTARRARCTCTTSPTRRKRWRSTGCSPSCGRPRSTP